MGYKKLSFDAESGPIWCGHTSHNSHLSKNENLFSFGSLSKIILTDM